MENMIIILLIESLKHHILSMSKHNFNNIIKGSNLQLAVLIHCRHRLFEMGIQNRRPQQITKVNALPVTSL